MSHRQLQFKVATEIWEFELIHQLNHKTFTEEIPQHEPTANARLVDKFHDQNIYLICLDQKKLVGMVAIRGNRPFSLDQKLPGLETYLPLKRKLCEIRLLAIEKEYRHSLVFAKLVNALVEFGKTHGYDMAIISGTVRQLKLYRHLGFVPFGPLVGSAEARYQPMLLALEDFEKQNTSLVSLIPTLNRQQPINFLPGPVAINPSVQLAFTQAPISHRSDSFMKMFEQIREHLCLLTQSRYVEILLGSGTLANDVVAAQLSLRLKKGLILSNGEFGDRLIDHATRLELSFDIYRADWGDIFDLKRLGSFMDKNPHIDWLWVAHCETSTGVLNDMETLKKICASRGVKLCLDCISSIGTVPLDLRGVYLTSGVSGKGLASFPGLAMIFYDHKITPMPKKLPRYLDLAYYANSNGVAFTQSSNLVSALATALQHFNENKFTALEKTAQQLRAKLRSAGFKIVAVDNITSPAITTIALPSSLSSKLFGEKLEAQNYLISYASDYLLQRNWIQVCLMGEYSNHMIDSLIQALEKLNSKSTRFNYAA